MSAQYENKLVGVIIAGGRGKRLNPLSLTIPKTLFPICNKPIIFHQIEYFKKLGIKHIYVVVGVLGDQIQQALGDGALLDVNVRYIIQDVPNGSGWATGLLAEHIHSNFALFLGDIYVRMEVTQEHVVQIKKSAAENITLLACVREPDVERVKQNFEIFLDRKGHVIGVKEKPANPATDLKGIGLYLFTPKIFDAIERTPRSHKKNEYELTDAIQILVEDKSNIVKPLEVTGSDFNISSAVDLYRANLFCRRHSVSHSIVGGDCDIAVDAQLVDSIIGNNVVIRHPIKIDKSVVLSNSVVDSQEDISNTLISSDYIIEIVGNDIKRLYSQPSLL
jgi:glucose-1-phosphate thymidylyltransferase